MAGAAGSALASSWLLQACGRATPADDNPPPPPDIQMWGGAADTMAAPLDSGMPEVSGGLPDAMPAPVDVRPADAGMPEAFGGVADAMAAPLDGAADLDPADGTYDNGDDGSP